MTKTILSTKLTEVNGIKFICRKCHAYFYVPLDKNNPPEDCFSCGKHLSRKTIQESIDAFKYLIKLSDADEFDLVIETEQK